LGGIVGRVMVISTIAWNVNGLGAQGKM
jgi:hypothetical protein